MTATATKIDTFNYQPVRLKLSQLIDNTRNARTKINEAKTKELAESAKEAGTFENRPVVRRVGDKYEIKQGSRRFAAAKLNKWEEMECSLAPDTITEEQHDLRSLIENLQRESLTPQEEAMGYRRLSVDYNFKGADIARKTGISASHVNNMLRAAQNLSPEIMEQWSAGNKLANFDTVVKLASIKGKDGEPDHAAQNSAWEQIAKGGKFVGGNVVNAGGDVEGTAEDDGDGEGPKSRKQSHRVLMKNVLSTVQFLKDSGTQLKPPANMADWLGSLISFFLGKRARPPEGIVFPKAEPKAKAVKNGKKKAKKASKKE